LAESSHLGAGRRSSKAMAFDTQCGPHPDGPDAPDAAALKYLRRQTSDGFKDLDTGDWILGTGSFGCLRCLLVIFIVTWR